jgi:hypothetical protein
MGEAGKEQIFPYRGNFPLGIKDDPGEWKHAVWHFHVMFYWVGEKG